MNTKFLIGLFVATLFPVHILLCAQAKARGEAVVAQPLNNLEITAKKSSNYDDGKLSFVVKNGGVSAIKVVKDYLPWNTTAALKLIAVPLPKGTPVEAVLPLEDPRATILEIPGNGEFYGELDPTPFFPRWKELTKKGVLLVWSLNLYDTETGYAKRFSGVIEY